jgi:bifunctional non-homologous end joining protein LigD
VIARDVAFSNLGKVLWPVSGMTKGQMIDYYRAVAPALVPQVAGRAMTLARFPDGVSGAGWFQMNCRGNPEWVQIAEVEGRSGAKLRYCVINDSASLLWVANLGTIELHPFLSSVDTSDRPHAVVFDLDPGPPAGLLAAAEIALRLRGQLDALGLSSFPKVSGRAGMHVYVPVNGGHSFEETRAFARATARELSAAVPGQVVEQMSRAARAGKVFIDWRQNHAGLSTIAPWSLRAIPRPRVACPVRWEEVARAVREKNEAMLSFGPEDALRRLDALGDLFEPVVRLKQALPLPS